MPDAARMFAPLTTEERAAAASQAAVTGTPGSRSEAKTPIIPVPPDAPPAAGFRHPKHGAPSQLWPYHDAAGRLLGYAARFDFKTENGAPGKDVLPLTFCNLGNGSRGWRAKGIPDPRPLYKLPEVLARSDALVLVTEGEKAADAAAALFPDLVATSPMHGAKSPHKADWSALAGRAVAVWPDHDEPGAAFAEAVARLAKDAGAASVAVVRVPADLPSAWDLADQPPPGVTVDDLRDMVKDAMPFTNADSAPEPEDNAGPDPESISARAWGDRTIEPTEWLLGPFARTTRAMLSAPSGAGKTNFALALAAHMAAGLDFLHWTARRPARVLYIDGEMPCELIQQRLRDAERRLGRPADGLYVLAKDALPDMPPLNTPEGQAFVDRWIEAVKPDFIVFDNVMSLLAGEMSDETGWQPIKPWIAALTNHRIGQLWVHHTGHDGSRPFGTSTRVWNFDASILLAPLKGDDDVAFALEFLKARRRTPDTRDDYSTITVALADDTWTVSATGNPVSRTPARDKPPSPTAQRYHDALVNAIASATGEDRRLGPGRIPATGNDAWKREVIRMGLIDKDEPDNRQRAKFSKYRAELVAAKWIAVDGETVWSRRLPHTEQASSDHARPSAQPSRNHRSAPESNHSATMRNPLSNCGATSRNQKPSPKRNHAQPSSIGDGCTVAGLRDGAQGTNADDPEPGNDAEMF